MIVIDGRLHSRLALQSTSSFMLWSTHITHTDFHYTGVRFASTSPDASSASFSVPTHCCDTGAVEPGIAVTEHLADA
jgi:hypothetical protein